MKKQIKKIFLIISLITNISAISAASVGTMDPNMAPPAGQMQMPSVSDVFAGMSEDEITKQVQEAQKLFETLTPEEMAEFEKVIEATLSNMSEEDIQDIEGIAKMVEPHLDLPKEEPKKEDTDKKIKEEKPAKKKKAVDSIDTNTIQDLIDNISKQIDDVLQKANSDKDLAKEFTSKWSSKVTFDNMKRQIISLKQDRLAKKLMKKENQEDKDLVEKLENFHTNLKQKNSAFKVEDTFGLPSTSQSQNKEQLKKAKDIRALFEDTIDDTMPILEKFLRKYDPEALEMAKEAEDRAKRSKTHAQDATVRRGSAPVAPTPEPYGVAGGPAFSGPSGYGVDTGVYPGAYDQYGSPYYGPDAGYDPSGFGSPFGSDTGTGKSPEEKGKAKDAKEQPKTTDQDKKDSTAYDNATEELESHFDHFNNEAEIKSLDFLNNKLSTYPTATDQVKISNDQAQDEWLTSSNQFAKEGFKLYSDSMTTDMTPLTQELKDSHSALDEVENNIANMSEEQLKKLSNNTHIKRMQNRTKQYKDALDATLIKMNDQFQANIDPNGTPNKGAIISDQRRQTYTHAHQLLVERVKDNIQSKIIGLEDQLDKVKSKIRAKAKRHQRKSKAAQATKK